MVDKSNFIYVLYEYYHFNKISIYIYINYYFVLIFHNNNKGNLKIIIIKICVSFRCLYKNNNYV